MDDALTRAVNAAFQKAYPGELSPPTTDPEILVKRVDMLLDDLLCTRVNFSVTNRAYCDLDQALRGRSFFTRLYWRWKMKRHYGRRKG